MPKVTQQVGSNPSHRQLPVGSGVQENSWHELQGLEPKRCKAVPLRRLFSCVKGNMASSASSLQACRGGPSSRDCTPLPAEESDGTSRRSLHATGACIAPIIYFGQDTRCDIKGVSCWSEKAAKGPELLLGPPGAASTPARIGIRLLCFNPTLLSET